MRLGGRDPNAQPPTWVKAANPGILRGIMQKGIDGIEPALGWVNGLRDATMILGPKATSLVARTTRVASEYHSEFIQPVIEASRAGGYDIKGDKAVEDSIYELFKNTKRGDIYSGVVDPEKYGIPAKLVGMVKMMDYGLHQVPERLGFHGRGNYYFKKGFYNGDEPTLLWDPDTGKSNVGLPDPAQFRNSALKPRTSDGPAPDDRTVLSSYITHMQKMAHQAAAQPFVNIDGKYIPITNKLRETLLARAVRNNPDPNAMPLYQHLTSEYGQDWDQAYTHFYNLAHDESVPSSHRDAAQIILNNILTKTNLLQSDKVFRRGYSNYVGAILTNRLSAGLKNYPTIFMTSDVPIGQLTTAGKEVLSDPNVFNFLKRYQMMTFKDLERLRTGMSTHDYIHGNGFDVYTRLEKHSRAMTFWGSIRDTAQKENIPWQEIFDGKTPRAKRAVEQGFVQIRNSQPNWSPFSGRASLDNMLAASIFLFKQSKITEAERLMFFVNQARKGEIQPLLRYATLGYLLKGPGFLTDPKMSNVILHSGLQMSPEQQKFFEDARDGRGGVLQMVQDASHLNDDIPQSAMGSTVNMTDVPFSDQYSFADQAGQAWNTFHNPAAQPQDKVNSAMGVLSPVASVFMGPTNVAGIQTSPQMVEGLTKAAMNMGRHSELYQGQQVPIDPASELGRVVLSGNVKKEHLQNKQPDQQTLKSHLRDNQEHTGNTNNVSTNAEFDRYFNNYKDQLATRFRGKFQNETELKELARNAMKNSIVDSDGHLRMLQPEWARIRSLLDAETKARAKGDNSEAIAYHKDYVGTVNELKRKYPYLTEQMIQAKYQGVR